LKTLGCRPQRHLTLFFSSLLSSALLAGCATTAPRPIDRRDGFPLDPREELNGPFSESVQRGCEALADGDGRAAEAAFAAARSGDPRRLAAEIGWIEALVLENRATEALPDCEKLLAAGDPTLPLLVACGEAKARAGRVVEAHALYRRAVARDGKRAGVNDRAEELRLASRDRWLSLARAAADRSEWARSRADIAEAIALAPESSSLRTAAGDIESQSGEKAAALKRYREAMEIEPRNPAVLEKTGNFALELGDYALAVSAFERLARSDPRAVSRAAEARLAFRVANWPPAEREAAASPRLTRAGAAELVWWMCPEVREARVNSRVIASDAVSRRDSRAITRAVALGLLEVDGEKHRVSPDAALSLPAAAKLLVRLLAILKPGPGPVACVRKSSRGPLTNAEALRVSTACGLISDREGPGVSGSAFLRALDRARSLVAEKGAS